MAEIRGAYYVPNSPFFDRFSENAPTILKSLFQYETSTAITAAFVFLLLALIVAIIVKIGRRRLDGELAFIFLLLGEFASMFLMLSISYRSLPRYWSVLIPLLASFLAFSAKFLLDAAKRNSAFANCTATALTIFVVFFVSANYYNFLHHFIAQHSARNIDHSAILKVASLLNNGQYVQANPTDWGTGQLKSLNTPFNHQTYWPNSPYGDNSIHKVPPSNPRQPYYILDFMGKPCANGVHGVHANLIGRADYGVLGYAAKLSGFLQGRVPHTTIDTVSGQSLLGEYSWVIYAISNGMGECAPCLRKVFFDGETASYTSKLSETIRPGCTSYP